MPEVVIYTTAWCPFCHRAKDLLDEKNIDFNEIDVNEAPEQRAIMEQRSQRRTVPQIFINGKHVGGCDDLYALDDQGKLDELLSD